MKRVKTVRAAWQSTISAIVGSTRSIHGVSQTPPLAKIRCMSTHRWTAFSIGLIGWSFCDNGLFTGGHHGRLMADPGEVASTSRRPRRLAANAPTVSVFPTDERRTPAASVHRPGDDDPRPQRPRK